MGKIMPLHVYRGKEKVEIGTAEVHDDTGLIACEIKDLQMIDDMKISVGDFSIGWMHPAAQAKDWRGGGTLNDIMDRPLDELTIRFKRPTLEELNNG